MTIDTGEERSVVGHALSGALSAGMVSGTLNYNRYRQEQMSKEKALKNTLKLTLQGGIVTASAIAASNYVGRNSYLGVLTAVSLGVAGIYGVEKLYEKSLDESEALPTPLKGE